MPEPQRRPVIERTAVVKRGPRFYVADGKVMFVLQMDGSTRIGPREATEQDLKDHPEAYAAACEEEPVQVNPPLVTPNRSAVDPDPAPKPHAERRARAAERGETA